jgi:diguanylate cyclase (GGDEF)-like protein
MPKAMRQLSLKATMTGSRYFPHVLAALRRNFGPLEIAVVAGGAVVFFILSYANAFDWFYEVTRAHENWQFDEVANVFVVATVGLAIILYARAQRLASEIQHRILAEIEAAALARHDPLTGIANRRLFDEELERFLARATRAQQNFAVLLVDLNRFKAVNDAHGHRTGDKLLVAVAERLKHLARREDILARLGGDEFAFAIYDSGKETAMRFADRLISALEEPFDLGRITVDIGASIGIALFPDDATDAERLVQRSDQAMYRAKASTASSYAFFDVSIDETLRDRAALEADLRLAIGTDAIVPYYQPLIDLADGGTFGFEVLARWNHATRGILQPDTFIPLAEDLRLIGELSLGLLRRAVSDAANWDPQLILSVNIAPDQFQDKNLAEKLLDVLIAANFPPSRLEIELTETALIVDLDAARRAIGQLKAAGVRVAIDDFGKGYSSLYYLRELPFDVVKIDQSFIGTRRSNPESAKIVSAVIGLSEALGLTTVAEGIEEGEDTDWLRDQGCSAGQGFLYSVPVPAAEVPALLASGKPKTHLSAA